MMSKRARKRSAHAQMRAVDGLGRLLTGMASMLDDSAQVAFSNVDGVYYPEAKAERGEAPTAPKRRFSELRNGSHTERYSRRIIGTGTLQRVQGQRIDLRV